jgi:hypothetical protein
MPRSDPPAVTRRRPDWRGWIILAWVVWWGLLYGTMVVEKRGGKVRGWIVRLRGDVRPPAKSRAAGRNPMLTAPDLAPRVVPARRVSR